MQKLNLPYTIGINITFLDGLLILLAASVAGFFVRYIFKKYSNTISSSNSFGNTIFLITICVASLIAVVKSSLALSLGLVGALSVVRFRTAVKEPYNLACILFSICLGISIGAEQYSFSLLIALFGYAAIYFSHLSAVKNNSIKNFIELDTLTISFNNEKNLSNIYKILGKVSKKYIIKSLTRDSKNNTFLSIGIDLENNDKLNELQIFLEKEEGFEELVFFNSPSNF